MEATFGNLVSGVYYLENYNPIMQLHTSTNNSSLLFIIDDALEIKHLLEIKKENEKYYQTYFKLLYTKYFKK